jgi:hypothetical protein
MGRRLAPDQIERDLDLAPGRDLGGSRAQILVERVHDGGVGAAAVDGKGDLAGDDVARGFCDHGFPNGSDRLWAMLPRDALHRQHDFRERRECVAAQWHRRGAGMAFEAGDLAVVPQHALAGIDHADGFAFGFENRALLDMQFDKTREFLGADRRRAAIADALQCLRHGDAFGILARQNIVGGEIADIGGRGHHRRRKARAFFVGPVADADRALRLDPSIVEGAHHFKCCQRAQDAVVLAPRGLGIEMRAEPHRRLRHVASPTQAKHRAERIDMDVETGGFAGLFEPVAHLLVLRPERQPLDAAFRRGAELGGFVDGVPQAGGIDLQIGCDFGHSAISEKSLGVSCAVAW